MLTALTLACASWGLVGEGPGPDPGELIPHLFDPPAVYRTMGFLTAPDPIPFVAAARREGGELIASVRLTAQEIMDALDALEASD